MPSARTRPCSGGGAGSCAPDITSVGDVMDPSRDRESHATMASQHDAYPSPGVAAIMSRICATVSGAVFLKSSVNQRATTPSAIVATPSVRAVSARSTNVSRSANWAEVQSSARALTRSGARRATAWLIAPPSDTPANAAWSTPRWSRVSRTSSARSSTKYGPSGTREPPCPRVSMVSTRYSPASSRRCGAHMSTVEPSEQSRTTAGASGGPSSTTWRRTVPPSPIGRRPDTGLPAIGSRSRVELRRVPRERGDLDVHVGEERQAGEQLVQLVARIDVEAADVRVAPHDPPELGPLAGALDLVGAGLLAGAQVVGDILRHVVGQTDVHADEELHGVLRDRRRFPDVQCQQRDFSDVQSTR